MNTVKKSKQIRKQYALDVQFIAQYYFPIATITAYTSSKSPLGNVAFFVAFKASMTAYGRSLFTETTYCPYVTERVIRCVDDCWECVEDTGFSNFLKELRSFFRPFQCGSLYEFIS